MKHILLTISFFLSISTSLIANTTSEINLIKVESVFNKIIDSTIINDGPFIFIEENHLVEKRIVNSKVVIKNLAINSLQTQFNTEPSIFKGVKKIAALSDIHGKYDLAVKILKNNKIIDKNLNWSFGKGHLVILGDIFDRGEKVTDMLWLVFNLEQQAKKKGGKVHYLLGNHDYMVLHNDLRYLNKKDILSAKLLETTYNEFFTNKTVLGRWLRSKPTIIKINDNLFVHAGISEEFLSLGFNIEEINNTLRASIDRTKKEMKSSSFYKNYYGSNGPMWYRGYFKDDFKEIEINNILKQVDAKHIIVGHTSQEKVLQFFNNKILAIDSSIKKGKYGEILFIKKGSYYRGTLEGDKIKL